MQVSFQITRIGGNAANNTLILQQVIASMVDAKVEAELFSSIPDDGDLLKLRNFFLELWIISFRLLQTHCIDHRKSKIRDNNDFPTSIVIVNRKNGSRTILHYRGTLPETTFDDFKEAYSEDIEEGQISWIHFEGGNNLYFSRT